MPRAPLAILLGIVALAVLPAHGRATNVREFVLDNGLKVLLLEQHKTPAVTFQVWYRVGSRNEQDGTSGLSHFLEHMMFKGTPSTKPEEYSQIIAKNGGRSNAFTTQDVTVYFATLSRDKIDIEIELEADRMAHATLGEEYFAAEKKVVEEERRLRTEDRPASVLSEATGAVAYLIHPYRRPVVGWMEDIENLTRRDLVDYYKLYYSPNNAYIVATGDFATETMAAKIKSAFDKIPRGPEPPPVRSRELPQQGERRLILKRPAELPVLLMFYHAPNLKDPDHFALDVLAVALAGGHSSRLYRDLVYEKRMARSVDADYDENSVDPGGFTVSAQLMPGKEPAEAEHGIDAVIDRLKSELIGERELQKAKNQIEADFIFSQDSIFGQAMKIGSYEAAGGWRFMDGYIEGIKRVTREDIRRVAQKYLAADRRTVGTLMPIAEKSK